MPQHEYKPKDIEKANKYFCQTGRAGEELINEYFDKEDVYKRQVQLLEFGADMETFRVAPDYYVVKFTVPDKFIGYYANELNLDKEFGPVSYTHLVGERCGSRDCRNRMFCRMVGRTGTRWGQS